MITNPVLPGWALAGIAVAFGGFALWRLIASRHDRATAARWLARLGMIALLLVIAVRPTIPSDGQGPKASGGLEVYVVIDTTSSMAAEDWDGGEPRLNGAKADIEQLVNSLVGAQFSLVTFDAVAVQRVPLTTDGSAMISAVSVLRQEITTYSRGSSIDVAVPRLSTMLSQAQERSPDQRRVLFYLGDGEQTAARSAGTFDELAGYLDGGAVLGYGSADGARMPEYLGDRPTQFGDTATTAPTPTPERSVTYIQDYSGAEPRDAISRIDEPVLQMIADQLGVRYLHRTSGASVLPALAGIEVGAVTVEPGEPDSSVELYWVFVIPFGLLVLLELWGVGALVLELRGGRRNP